MNIHNKIAEVIQFPFTAPRELLLATGKVGGKVQIAPASHIEPWNVKLHSKYFVSKLRP